MATSTYSDEKRSVVSSGEENQSKTCKAGNEFLQEFLEKADYFYLDGICFAHNHNPQGDACAVNAMAWRIPNEVLDGTPTKKEGSDGKMANLLLQLHTTKG